jgi:hypothetical protein
VRPDEFGTLIQAYVREKSRPSAAREERLRQIAAELDAKMRLRIDALGLDGEQLLAVPPGDVLVRIQALEAEASAEDARAAAAAARLRPHDEAARAQQRQQPTRQPRAGARGHRFAGAAGAKGSRGRRR